MKNKVSPIMLLTEGILLSVVFYSFYNLYYSVSGAAQYLMVSMSLIAVFYIGSAFHQIFLGLRQKASSFGMIIIFSFFALAFMCTGLLSAVFVFPAARTIIVIGLVSSVGCLLLLTGKRKHYFEQAGLTTVNLVFTRLLFFSFASFLFLRTESEDLYKVIGPLKNDEKAIELLKECSRKPEHCQEFWQYQKSKI